MYEESAYAVAEGQKLYEAYNCVGCHAHGGGGIGPPLMDRNWIYGSEPGKLVTVNDQMVFVDDANPANSACSCCFRPTWADKGPMMCAARSGRNARK